MNFVSSKLGDICDKVGGVIKTGPFGSQLHQSDYQNDGTPVIMPKDITDNGFSVTSIARVGQTHVDRLTKHKLTIGDIVYGRRGDIGRCGIVTEREKNWLCGTGCLRISVGNNILFPHFLYYFLRQPNTIEEIKNRAIGATMPNLNTEVLRNIVIRYPDLFVQKKIAGILSAYDDLIENNQRRIKILEEMAQNLYREWFVKFRFPIYRPDGSIERYHNPETDHMQDSPLGSIPQNWKPAVLGDICKENRISASPENFPKDTPYIGLEHMPRRSITLSEWGRLDDVISTKLLYKKGDILFGKIRPYFHKVGVTLTDGLCSSDAIVINPLNKIHLGQVLCCFSSDDFVAQAAKSSQGTKMPRANWNVMIQYPCPLPNDYLSTTFSGQISLLVNQCGALALKNKNLQQTRDLLLPKLISGEIEV